MIRILLIRPGATDFDDQQRILGDLDMPLNQQGEQEVARMLEELRPSGLQTVYFADCESARQTALRLAEGLGIKSRPLKKLRNLKHGLWQGMRIDEVKQKYPSVYRQWQEHPDTVGLPDGETLDAARQRVETALQSILKRRKQGVIGVVAPEPLARLMRADLTQGEIGNLWEAACEHGNWEAIDVQPLGTTTR